MRRACVLALLLLSVPLGALARPARLVRYPDYHAGRIAFTYLGDIWTADQNGKDVRRLTVHTARDIFPRFSPDGKWIAFSSERSGNLDVYVLPVEGGTARQLTFHSADDTVLGWSPDSRSVLFASNRGEEFTGKLYTVSLEGGLPRSAGPDMGLYASYSPDGRKLAINRRSQSYWRKYYRGAYQSDVTVMDVAARQFTDVTDFDGMDTWPMWGRDRFIYFVSDREGSGLTNVWRVAESGGKAERVTRFTSGDVRWPAISSDGKVIVFEHDFGIWKLELDSRRAAPIPLDIAAETQDNLVEVREFNSQVDEYDLAPTGRRIAFSIHGEIFTAPTDEGDLRQLTDGPARDRDPHFSPDGKWIAFISDRSGREEIYVAAAAGAGEARKLTDRDVLKYSHVWSPDSKEILFTTSDNRLLKCVVETGQVTELAAARYGGISSPVWSPDGRWIAYARADAARNTDVYLLPAGGGEERRVTFDSASDASPRFAPDGRKLFFIRREGRGGGDPSAQVYAVTLERETRDPSEPEERAEASDEADTTGDAAARRTTAGTRPPAKEIEIDWAGLKRRTRAVTRMPFAVFSFAVSPDSRTVVFTTSEPSGTRTVPVLYSIGADGRRLTRLASSGAQGDGESAEDTAAGGGGFAGLRFARDGRTLYFEQGGGVYSMAMAGAGGTGRATTGTTGTAGARRRISFSVRVRIDRPAEWAEMFDDAWRTMKYRFYDPKMHGKDWDAARAKYQPLVQYAGDRQEVLNLVNEMIGELNASHTGSAPPAGGRAGAVATRHLGIELAPDEEAGRYRVTQVYEDGPADKDWVKLSVGDYLLAIDGKPLAAGDNYWRLLNERLNRKVELTLNSKPAVDGAWKTRLEPISTAAYRQLRYDLWVKQRRETAEKLSGGRVGYVHIQAMNPASLRKFEKELRENRTKEALIIDERWNGGGNIEQELLALLAQRQYQVWQPRGTEAEARPFAGFFGPKIVLQNWRSASNAEMFPAGFRALGLGKVIGTPTMGAVIGTGSYTLIDGSTVRTPAVGVYLADTKQTNMENYGVQPDIRVENTPEDSLKGYDRQLETAVQELLKELGAKKPPAQSAAR